jgi:hypothetical protein
VAVVRGGASAERSTTPRMKHAFLVGAALILGGSVGHAQASGDSARAQPNDSLARAKADTAAGGTKDSAAAKQAAQPSAAPARAAAPVDSILAAACRETLPGRPAPGLLTVVFRPGTPDTARIGAAKAISGTLSGTTASGEEYVRLSPESGPLVLAAARLIELPPVTSVSEKSCP